MNKTFSPPQNASDGTTTPPSKSSTNKTLYCKEEDAHIWDKARELTGDKLSSFVMDVLRRFVAEEEQKANGYRRIVTKYHQEDGIPQAKAFLGRWLLPPDKPADIYFYDSSGIAYDAEFCAVAQTAKGNYVAIKFRSETTTTDNEFLPIATFQVFEKVEDLKVISPEVVAATMKALGVAVQELDI